MRAPAPTRPRRRFAVALLIAAALGSGVLAACSGSDRQGVTMIEQAPAVERPDGDHERVAGTTMGTSAGPAATPSQAREDANQAPSTAGTAGEQGNSGKPESTTEPPVTQGRDIIRTGSFTMAVTVPQTDDEDADQKALRQKVNGVGVRARAVATGVGGYVSASEGDGVTQSITMRIPAGKYDAAREALAAIGELTGSESSQDVTGQLADLDGRIATMKASVDRVRQLLAKATKISEIVALESELAQREGDLEALMRQRAALSDQVSLSTITLVVAGSVVPDDGTVPPSNLPEDLSLTMVGKAPTGFAGGVDAAYQVMIQVGAAAATIAGATLPFLALLALLVLAGMAIMRRSRTRRLAGN